MTARHPEIPTFAARAREELTEKLKDGKRVGRCTLFDLIDCELQSDFYKSLIEDVGSLLMGCERYSRDEQAEKIMEGLIERYLDSHPDLIADEAVEIRHHYMEDQRA